MRGGPLDMRMDPRAGSLPPVKFTNGGEADIARVLKTFGEERLPSCCCALLSAIANSR